MIPGLASFNENLARTESGGNYSVVNSEGYGGKYQWGKDRLSDYNQSTGQDISFEQFVGTPAIQEQAQAWHVADIDKNLGKYVGTVINGVPMSLNALRAMAHLGGTGGAIRFVNSGGKFNPKDSNGTSLADYARIHGTGQMVESPATPPADLTGGDGMTLAMGGADGDSLDPMAALLARAAADGMAVPTIDQTYDPQAVVNAGDPLAALIARGAAASGGTTPGQIQASTQSAMQAASQPPPPTITIGDGSVMTFDPATGSYTSADLMAGNMAPSRTTAALSGAANGMTMGFAGELNAAVAGPMAGVRADATQLASQRDFPIANIAGGLAGGVAATVPLAMAAPAALTARMATASPLARIGTGLGIGATAGATQGAIMGAGEARPGQRADGALSGAAVGGALGGVLGGAAPMLSSGIAKLFTFLKGRDVSVISRTLNISPIAAQQVRDALDADDFTAAAAALRRAGPDAMLADAGPATGQLLDSAAQSGGAGNRVVQAAVNTRAEGAYGRLTATLDQVMGSPEGVQGAALKIAQRTATQRKTAYDAAYASPIDYAAPTGQAIDAVVARVPKDILSAAIKDANDLMQMDGKVNQQIKAIIAPDGAVTFSQPMNVQQLDSLKRSLDAIARDSVNSIGRPTPMAVKARAMASQLRQSIADAVPGYDAAVKLGGDKIAEDHALDLGRGIMNPNLTREDVRLGLGQASTEAKQAAAKGARSAIDDALANVKASLANSLTDIKEAQKMVSDLSSRAAREKLTLILGPGAQRVFDQLDTAASQLYLRGVVARGSQTAGRLATRDSVNDAIQGGPIAGLARGETVAVAKTMVQQLTNKTPIAQDAAKKAIFDDIAKALTGVRGPQAEAALAIIQRAATGQPISDAQAKMIGKTLTASGFLPLATYIIQSQTRQPGEK